MIQRTVRTLFLSTWLVLVSCRAEPPKVADASGRNSESPIETRLSQYTTVSLTTDLTRLSPRERQMLPLLISAARSMDEIFWRQADILGLYMVTKLHQRGELKAPLADNYVTFLASIFRSIRFGASNAHGRANAAQFSFFEERGAFSRDSAAGRYRVDFPRMKDAVDALAGQILRFQGDGDYVGVTRFMEERGELSPVLQRDLDRLGSKGIPVDVVFEQGEQILK